MKISSMINIVVLGPDNYEDRSEEVNKRNPNSGPVILTKAPVSIKLSTGVKDYTVADCNNVDSQPGFVIEDILTWPSFKSLHKSGKVSIVNSEPDLNTVYAKAKEKTAKTSLLDDQK